MTRSNPTELVEFDPEIEASARRAQGQLRREKKKRREQSNSERTANSTNEESTDSTNHPNDPAPPIEIPRAPMAEQTIRQLAAAPTVQQPLCITFPQGDTPFQLKTGLIHLLSTFHGLPSESPHKHLSEFHLVCSSMKPQGVSEDQIKLRDFPFSLSGIAKEWLFYLPPNSITTWTDLNNKFLDRFFPAAKASEIRRSILGIKQKYEETLHEYWERYKKLCASCPQHGLSEQTLVQYFYEGMLPTEMKIIDAASGGALCNMTPTQAKDLISTMAANSQQFGTISEPNQRVHEVSIVSLEKKFEQFTDMIASMLADKKSFRPCGLCTSTDHPTDGCPSLQDETVNAIGHSNAEIVLNTLDLSRSEVSGFWPESNPTELVEFDPEIEASARRAQGQLRREKKKRREQSNSERTTDSTNEESTDSTNHPNDPAPPIEIPRAPMAEQTIRQLAAAPTVQQPLCITFPQGDTPFQLKTGLIHLLSTFHGLPSESPHKHLSEFHLVCSSMKPQGVSEDQIKLRAFPFSLSGIAKEWLFYLPPNSITTWTDLNNKFLDRFFPAAKASEIRRSILGIKQKYEETLHEYWERYKKLCASCPQHGLSEQTLVQYFYEGLLPTEMKIIDAASGGALCNMTPTQAKDLISTMAANSQQFGTISEPNQRVHEVSIVSLEKKFEQFTDMIASMLADKKSFRPCGLCTSTDHPTDGCPSLQDETVNAIGHLHDVVPSLPEEVVVH
ncbi:hypothetical protein GQ457_06G007130 [Hibiscus cannabinus]